MLAAETTTLTPTAPLGEAVDRINAKFYGRFPYPWRPRSLDLMLDPELSRTMLMQDVGDWRHTRIPRNPQIWVAGCGTNQAVITALAFPNATVVGSDLSSASLNASRQTAAELAIDRLELRQESLNHVSYDAAFDYILCTGVVHHNADPAATLARIARALKPNGVLELMVYNTYHRTQTTAFQKALRTLTEDEGSAVFETKLATARAIVNQAASGLGSMGRAIGYLKDRVDVELADTLLQPVERSYTIETLAKLLARVGLELLTPCVNAFDKQANRIDWHLRFADAAVQQRYDALPDLRRWEVTNLLLLERSPMLWFHCARTDAAIPRQTERELCDGFLDARCRRVRAERRRYVLGGDQRYQPVATPVVYPLQQPEPPAKTVLDAVDGVRSMREVFQVAGIATDFATVNEMRLRLATSASPYLQATS